MESIYDVVKNKSIKLPEFKSPKEEWAKHDPSNWVTLNDDHGIIEGVKEYDVWIRLPVKETINVKGRIVR